MADDEAIFVGVWNEKWSRIAVPQQFTAPGTVRKLNIGALLGKVMPASADAGGKLIDGMFSDLKSLLRDRDGAIFWSSGPGQISVFYPKMQAQAADLAHSVICSTIERRIRDMVLVPARAATMESAAVLTQASKAERLVSWDDFQRITYKAKAPPELIQSIDIGELILGRADPAAHISKRAWRTVDAIVEEFLRVGGYCTRQSGNQILLFFPGLSASLARLKRNAIAAEIEISTGSMAPEDDGPDSDGEAETGRPATAKVKQEGGETAEEIARLNQAFAALGAASPTTKPVEHATGVIFHTAPVWRTRNQTLVGHRVFVQSGSGHIPVDLLDLSCLAKAHTDAQNGIAAQNAHLVIAQLHWYTLERVVTRTRYLELASKISEEARRYLIFSLQDVPEDLLPARIEDRLRELRPFARTISLATDLDRRDFSQFKGQEIHAVGSILENRGAERDVMLAMNGFMAALAPLQAKSFVDGLNTKSMVIAAIAAGFDYLSGTAIVDGRSDASGVRAFSIPDLYASDG